MPQRCYRPLFVLTTLLLVAPPALNGQTVRGILVDQHTGQPVALGEVLLLDDDREVVAEALTTEEGFFELRAPDDGSYLIEASGLGYWATMVGPFEIDDDELRIVEARVAARPVAIPGITVEARVGALVRNGFYSRMEREKGDFITPDEIAERDVAYVQQLFHGRSSTRVYETPSAAPRSLRRVGAENRSARTRRGAQTETEASLNGFHRPPLTVFMRSRRGTEIGPWASIVAIQRPGGGACVPWVYIDGVRVVANRGESLADMVPIQSVMAVEIYRAPFEGTLSFRDISRCECGALVFWTTFAT